MKDANRNSPPQVIVPQNLFRDTWVGLRTRGAAETETVAIWGGNRCGGRGEVTHVYFLNDLPNVEAHRLSHRVPRESLNKVLRVLSNDGCMIIADVHTHPSDWVDLSPVDRDNPTEFRVGFVSVVIPDLALGSPTPGTVGVHVYMGDGRWTMVRPPSQCLKIV